MVVGDCSTRFLQYVLSKSKKVACYTEISKDFLNHDNHILYTCTNNKTYMAQRRLRILKGPMIKDLKPDIKEEGVNEKTRRVFMPKAWTNAKTAELKSLCTDKKIKFIVFPVYCAGNANCEDDDYNIRKSHSVLFVYNKDRNELEFWDDLYGETQTKFALYRLTRKYMQIYIIPILASIFGLSVSDKISMPTFSEQTYTVIKRSLDADNIESNYRACYMAFLAYFISQRLKTPKQSVKNIIKTLDTEEMKRKYQELLEYSREWKMNHRCDDPGKVVNFETGKCVKTGTKEAFESLGVTDTCPYPQLRNIETGRCKDIIVHQHYIERDNALHIHVRERWTALMKYFIAKYPFMATAPENKFFWQMNDTTKEWHLRSPSTLHKIMEKALKSPKITHVLFFINLVGNDMNVAHLNTLIIDKKGNTIERFEPNEPEEWDLFNNGSQLDKALMEAFQKYNFEYLPMEQTCPIGFQDLEMRQDSHGLRKFNGNCALWSLWYMDLRMANPHIPRLELIKNAWKYLAKEGAYKHFIHAYHDHLLRATSAK